MKVKEKEEAEALAEQEMQQSKIMMTHSLILHIDTLMLWFMIFDLLLLNLDVQKKNGPKLRNRKWSFQSLNPVQMQLSL